MGDAGSAAALLPGGSMGQATWCDELCAFLRKAVGPREESSRISRAFEVRMAHGRTAFLRACTEGHVECMELLAQAGCDTTVMGNNGDNALMCAVHSGEAAAVRAALDAGWCEPDARSRQGITAFLAACNTGDTESVKLLAQAGCNTAAMDSTGANALIHTASSGEAAAVRAALDAGWCDLEARATGGLTAFLRACYTGDTECMELLVRAGCDTAAANSGGCNALILTA
jgi:ankyrin